MSVVCLLLMMRLPGKIVKIEILASILGDRLVHLESTWAMHCSFVQLTRHDRT